MKRLIACLLFATPFFAAAQQHSLEKLWETDSIIAVPESVLPDPGNRMLYISLIDGSPWEADGKGGVGKLSADGKHYNGKWVTGLNAPKGLGRFGNRLYVADISEVVVIDISSGKIIRKIAVPGASGLNDITVDREGIVYVSDSKKGTIHRIVNDVPELYLDNKPGVNGLKSVGSDLYIFNGKYFEKAGPDKQITPILQLDAGGDGIEPAGKGDFLLTIWGGYIYYAHANGQKELLLDTHLEKSNTADIGYDAARKILYVPTFNAKRIVAYRLK